MKLKLALLLIAFITLLVNCGDNKAAISEKQSADNSTEPATKNPAFAATGSANGIVGTWKLIMETFDVNFNEKLDDDERKSEMKNNTPENKMHFNANGTCKIQSRYNGTYNIKEDSGKKILFVQL
ncbi:MAG TPA: lipocalin family protein, partial [Chitinophagaceae bacterium]